MIQPHTAVALQTLHHNCRTQEDWNKNLDTICEAMDATVGWPHCDIPPGK